MRVLGIAGSLRSGSHNRELLRLAASLLPDGVELETWDGLRDLPAFDEDAEDPAPMAVSRPTKSSSARACCGRRSSWTCTPSSST